MANTFSEVTDYFGLASNSLVPEYSDSGDQKYYQAAYNGQSETPASQSAATWRNPTVRYHVVRNMTLDVTLGNAFAGASNLTSMTRTGYMITSVEIDTSIGETPTVTVKGVANEGYIMAGGSYTVRATPAIKTYRIQIPMTARHRAQDLMSCVNVGSGELQSLSLVASADPVVLVENGIPCASDICHGKIQASAKVAAYGGESAPTAGSGFTLLGVPTYGAGTYYRSYLIKVTKELY